MTNYKSGAEERLRANAAKASGYNQTLDKLSQTEPEAAAKFAEDPNKAVYLLFHNDLSQMTKDLKEIDTATEQVKLAGGINLFHFPQLAFPGDHILTVVSEGEGEDSIANSQMLDASEQ